MFNRLIKRNSFKITLDLLWYMGLGVVGTFLLVMWVSTLVNWTGKEFSSIGWLIALVFMYVIHGMRAVVKNWRAEARAPIDVLYSPGDVVDKLTILDLKLAKFKDSNKLDIIREETFKTTLFLSELIRSADPDKQALQELSDELEAINRRQWEYENQVRSEGGSEATQAARSNNMKRVRVKNEINRLFNFPTEQKEYVS